MTDQNTPSPLDDAELARLEGLAEKATKGPRRWRVNRQYKTVELGGGSPRFDKSIMTFQRFGMRGAAPAFWFWENGRNWSEEPKRADELAVAEPGREHHQKWHALIDHPDAQFLEISPDDVLRLIATIRAERARADTAEAEREELREAIMGAKPDYSFALTNATFTAMTRAMHAGIIGGVARAEAAEAEVKRLREALLPFVMLIGDWTDANGWTNAACKKDRICDWFGPSDFRNARAALGGNHDQ